jgi:hypothetical protein
MVDAVFPVLDDQVNDDGQGEDELQGDEVGGNHRRLEAQQAEQPIRIDTT